MGSEKLSTHPSGKKTSAAHFEHLPTRRLVYNSSLRTNNFSLLFLISKNHYEAREAIASKKYLVSENSIWITHLKRLYVTSLRSRFYYQFLTFIFIHRKSLRLHLIFNSRNIYFYRYTLINIRHGLTRFYIF